MKAVLQQHKTLTELTNRQRELETAINRLNYAETDVEKDAAILEITAAELKLNALFIREKGYQTV